MVGDVNMEEWGRETAVAEEQSMAVEGGEMRFGRIVGGGGVIGQEDGGGRPWSV